MTAKIDIIHWIPMASPWDDAKITLGCVIPGDACPRGIQFYQFNITWRKHGKTLNAIS